MASLVGIIIRVVWIYGFVWIGWVGFRDRGSEEEGRGKEDDWHSWMEGDLMKRAVGVGIGEMENQQSTKSGRLGI